MSRFQALVLVVFLTPSVGLGQQLYDTVVVGDLRDECSVVTPISPFPLAQWIGGSPFQETDIDAIAPGPDGRLFAAVVTYRPSQAFQIVEVRPDRTRTPLTASMPGWDPLAMVVDRAGSVYVLARGGGLPSHVHSLIAFSPAGTLRAIYPLGWKYSTADEYPLAQTAMDLAADQCTLFLLEWFGPIRRFDVCAGAFLADFGSPRFRGHNAIRVLPDGGVLVVSFAITPPQSFTLDRFDSSGVFIRSYLLNDERHREAAHALMLRDGGRRLVYSENEMCAGGRLMTIDLETGAVVSQLNVEPHVPTTVVPYFAWTAALGAFHQTEAAVPSLGLHAALLLAGLLAAIALVRIGRII